MKLKLALLGAAVACAVAVTPTQAHHSFAMYDGKYAKVFTGVVTRLNPDFAHLQIFFAPMNEERNNVERDSAGEPLIWAVEMRGANAVAQEGVTPAAFPPGTIISVGLHPLRNGQPAGERGAFGLFKCPPRTPPAAGQHCDTVEGATLHGTGVLPAEGALAEEYVPN